jgi:hypothetical protein
VVESGLIERNAHGLFLTTRAFLEFAGLSDLADLPSLVTASDERADVGLLDPGRIMTSEGAG